MPLEKAAPGTKGFENNIREMVESGHPQKQAVAAAYEAARGDADNPKLHEKMDRLLRELKNSSLSAKQFGDLLDLARILNRKGDLPARKDSAEPFATGPSPINQSAHPIDRVLAEAEKFYTRMDAVTKDCGRMDSMSSDDIRAAPTAKLKEITSGLVKGNTDNFSKQIAYKELEKRRK